MNKTLRVFTCLFLAAFSFACAAASRSPDTSQPGSAVPGYPATIAADEERRASMMDAWRSFAEAQGISADVPTPEFQPVTATIRTIALVTASSAFLRLPRIGTAEMNEEQTRESLRRFIASARAVLGVDPADLSLVAIENLENGAKRARYEQKPFLYNLRAGYGEIAITFAPDLRVVELSSTAIPEAERLRRTLAGITPRFNAEQAQAGLVGRTLTYRDGANVPQTIVVPTEANALTVRELVIYPTPRADDPSTLEFHLAWEIAISRTGAPDVLVYLDAIRNEVISVQPQR
jgi:hypothetical protein